MGDEDVLASAPDIDTDRDLWALVQRGNERAFEVLYRRHARAVYRRCWSLLSKHSRHDMAARSENAVSETFLHAWRRRHAIHLDGSLLPWLLTAAANVCQNLLRGERRHAQLALHVARQPSPADGPEPGRTVDRRDVLARVGRAIAGLEPTDAWVAQLCLLDGVPPQEAARRLHLAPAVVRARLFRVRRRLRVVLADVRVDLTRAGVLVATVLDPAFRDWHWLT